MTVSFAFLEPDFKVSLFLKQPGYAVCVLELPFPQVGLDVPMEEAGEEYGDENVDGDE